MEWILKLTATLIMLWVIGCAEQDNITLHQTHVYKGKPDQIKTQPQVLEARFKQVQTDR